MGLLRKELIETVGAAATRGDPHQARIRPRLAHGGSARELPWDSEDDFRTAGARIHTLQGQVFAERRPNSAEFVEAIWKIPTRRSSISCTWVEPTSSSRPSASFACTSALSPSPARSARILGNRSAQRGDAAGAGARAQAAAVDAPVLVTGESGVGKERIARLIHDCSARAHGVFVAINLRRGHRDTARERAVRARTGAFTGATQDRAGLFEAASGGTLFLDEVASCRTRCR